jgi:hypothetical protein
LVEGLGHGGQPRQGGQLVCDPELQVVLAQDAIAVGIVRAEREPVPLLRGLAHDKVKEQVGRQGGGPRGAQRQEDQRPEAAGELGGVLRHGRATAGELLKGEADLVVVAGAAVGLQLLPQPLEVVVVQHALRLLLDVAVAGHLAQLVLQRVAVRLCMALLLLGQQGKAHADAAAGGHRLRASQRGQARFKRRPQRRGHHHVNRVHGDRERERGREREREERYNGAANRREREREGN